MHAMKTLLYFFCFALAMLVGTRVLAQLDPSFGDGGIVRRPNGQFRALVALPDNTIVTVGAGAYPQTHWLAKYKENGHIDSSFANNGLQADNFGSLPFYAAVQSDGRIITVGGIIRRFLPDGQIDLSFGSNGRASVQMSVTDMALQADDKIIVALYGFALRRYLSGGWFDTSFGGTGTITTVFDTAANPFCRRIAILPDGKIVAAGEMNYSAPVQPKYIVARYNADGSLDTSFNHTGKQTTQIGTGQAMVCWDMTLQSDGKIVQCGAADSSIVLVRYNVDGSLDTSFNHTGILFYPGGFHDAHKIAVLADGRYIVGGIKTDESRIILHRFWPDGRIDSGFGVNGVAAPQLNSCDYLNGLYDMKLLSNSQVLAAGYSSDCAGNSDAVLVKFTADGQLTVPEMNTVSEVLQLYPNPALQDITITWPAEGKNITVFVTDVSGRCLYSDKVDKNVTSVRMNVSNFSAGSYFIILKTVDGWSRYAHFIKV